MARDLLEEAGYSPEEIQAAIAEHQAQSAPRDLLAEAGISPQEIEMAKKQYAPSIRGDVQSTLSNLPESIVNGIGKIPGEAIGMLSHPFRTAQNIPIGMAEGLEGLYNTPGNIARYGQSRGISGLDLLAKKLPHSNQVAMIAQALMGPNQAGDVLSRGIGGFAPYGMVGKGASGLAGLLSRGAQGAAYATGQNQNPLEAALVGGAGEGFGKMLGTTKGYLGEKLSPTNMFSSPLSAEQLREALRLTEGTKTPLGSVIQNPRLSKHFENVLQNIPFSGATKKLENIGSDIKSKGEGLFANMGKGANQEDLGAELGVALKNAHAETTAQKNALYKAAEDISEKHNVTVGRENTANKAKEILKDIKASPELAFTFDRRAKRVIEMLSNPSNQNTYKLSNIFKGKLNDMAQEAYTSGKAHEGNQLKSLADSLNQDIEHAISETKAPGLQAAHKNAQKYYREEYAPFQDTKIKKYLKEGADTDTMINSFLPKSRDKDQAILLRRLTDRLGPEHAGLLPASYFRPALEGGSLNVSKLISLYKDLGGRQKKALFKDPKMAKEFDDYIKLAQKNPESIHLMANPKTGARISHMLGLALGGAGLAGLVKSAAIPIAYGKAATEVLTHEGIRNAFVKKLIDKAESNSAQNNSKAAILAKKLATTKNLGRAATAINVKDKREK